MVKNRARGRGLGSHGAGYFSILLRSITKSLSSPLSRELTPRVILLNEQLSRFRHK